MVAAQSTLSALEFYEMELRWVRALRATKNPELLHLVEPAVARERELILLVNALRAPALVPVAAEEAPTYGGEGKPGAT